MARGDKNAYTNKQKRQAEHIEEGYKERGLPASEAAGRAWATVNKMTGGGKKSGSGVGKKVNKTPARKGGKKKAATAKTSLRAKRAAKKTTGRKKSGGKKTAGRKKPAAKKIAGKKESASKKRTNTAKKPR